MFSLTVSIAIPDILQIVRTLSIVCIANVGGPANPQIEKLPRRYTESSSTLHLPPTLHVMDHQEILAVHSSLHLIYHRNKNQHQRAKWWKWLSMLKRTALNLGSADSAKRASAYRQHLASHLAPRCHLYVTSTLTILSLISYSCEVQQDTD